jgi:hypothetical protein
MGSFNWPTEGEGGSSPLTLTGDVTGSGAGTVFTSVAFVGGEAASTIGSLISGATSAATPNTLVLRNNSGDITVSSVMTTEVVGVSGTLTISSPTNNDISINSGRDLLLNSQSGDSVLQVSEFAGSGYINVIGDMFDDSPSTYNLGYQAVANTLYPFKSLFIGSLGIYAGLTSGGLGQYATSSSICQLVTTTKTFNPPAMSTTQKNALTPIEGAVIWDLTLHALCVYDGTVWKTVTAV